MRNFIFFRNDNIGDFIILSSIIKRIRDKHKKSHITVVCSKKNYKFIKNYSIIDKLIIYDKKFNFYKKVELLFKILEKKYFISFAVDGKTFSNLCNLLLNAKFKLGICYKYKIKTPFFNFFWSKPNIFYKYFILDKYEDFTSKKHLTRIEHLPTKLLNLIKFFNLDINLKTKYFFEVNKSYINKYNNFKKKYLPRKFIVIHLDEKWLDINNIENDLSNTLNHFQKKIRKNILITSFNNNFPYYKNIKKKFPLMRFSEHKVKKFNFLNKSKILILENTSIPLFERIVNSSIFSISCHAGFLVHIAGFNNTNLIDIINKNDYLWYSCWKPKNTEHKFIYKSNNSKKYSLKKIFDDTFKSSKIF